jgi:hypothetical protein
MECPNRDVMVGRAKQFWHFSAANGIAHRVITPLRRAVYQGSVLGAVHAKGLYFSCVVRAN